MNPQGRSASFARAQIRGGITNSLSSAFLLSRAKDYSIGTIDNEAIDASMGDENAFLEGLTTEIDGAINSLVRSAAIAQYKSGFGEMGQIGVIATNTITLLNIDDVTNFEVGQELDLSATLAASTLRAYGTSGNGLIITQVDRTNGILTFGFNVTDATNGIPTAAANDFIFTRGDRQDSATPTALKLVGLEGWNPAAVPTSTAFFGVNRAVDPTRLAGQRLNGAALPIEEALNQGAGIVGREGQTITHYFMNFTKWTQLENSLGSKVQYIDMQVTPQVGFRGVVISGPKNLIKVVPDQNCPSNRIHGLNMEYVKLYSLGDMPKVLNSDGLQMLRQTSNDGVEFRYGYYGNFACRAPASMVNIQV